MAADGETNKGYIVGEIDRLIAGADSDCNDDVSRVTLTVLRHIYIELCDLKEQIRTNPFYSAGKFIRGNPKTALAILVIVIIMINLWSVPILVYLGIPAEIVP